MASSALVQVRAARKAQLVEKLGLRERALFNAELQLREAKEALDKEQADVEALSEQGPEHLLLSLTGQLDERLQTERDEAQAAAHAYFQCRHQRDRLRIEVTRVREGIERLGTPEQSLSVPQRDAQAEHSLALVRLMNGLSEAYEAQDALHLLRVSLERAAQASTSFSDTPGPAQAHARTLAVTAQERLGDFEQELTGLIHALASMGPKAPQPDLPEPGSLHRALLEAWRARSSLESLEPQWVRLEQQIADTVVHLQRILRDLIDDPQAPQWNVGALFLPEGKPH